ncbi:phage tail tape measure protein [Streptomyces sp. ME19-01-6]|uniref:phage tail tape measure protein n=1 Tax=Streptomyces sp. ME19-01-6 TaxID=3028686 RepID=UPI0029B4D5E1|nr:phage tail tape measure protein [Streptomyces sp. ME19-01-6]MDX3224566.1 phage tail tape measure protein [Streptomyces sp. ME19-01-6]
MAGFTLTVAMRAEVRDLIAGTRAASGQMRTLADRTDAAHRSLARLDANGVRLASQFAALNRSVRLAVGELNRISSRASAARASLRAAGDDGARSMSRLQRAMAGAGRRGISTTNLLAGGGLLLGAGEMVEEGNRYQRQMNLFRAVNDATAAQMKRAAVVAQELGNDLRLPGSTAADAAEGMVELSKAGFRADQSIDAVRASLQLAAAADVNAATSARYLGDIMDQYGLGADQAAKASDTLAATANSASGSITDIYYSMRYAGPVANALGVSLEDTAAAVGMLGKAGILGQTAGTSLRGIFANLAAPTPQMRRALKDLGIDAWDAQGKFRGLRVVIDGLSKAEHDLSDKDFAAGVTRAFGKPALSGAAALAHQGTESFDDLSMAVRQTGAAASITASRGQGLAGAMTQLRTQARQTGLALYNGMAPGLEYVTRLLTRGMAGATPYLTTVLEYGRNLAILYGPELKAKAGAGLGGLLDEARQLVGPLKALGEHALAAGLNLLINAARTLGEVIKNLAQGAEPVVAALSGISQGSGAAAGTLDILVTVANLAMDAVSGLSAVLVPIGHAVGGLVRAFGALPDPIQSAALALLLFRRFQPGLMSVANTVGGPVRGAFQGFAQQMQLQRNLAATTGISLTRYGAAWAALQARVGFLGNMTAAFRSANGAGVTFMGTLNGVTRAAGSGLRSAFSGLVGAMGGPWGAALAGATVVLGMLASAQQTAAAKAAQHKANIDGLANALRESNGVVTESVRQQAAQTIQAERLQHMNNSLMDVMRLSGYSLKDVTDAYLGQGTSLDQLAAKMRSLAKEQRAAFEKTSRGDSNRDALAMRALAYQEAAKSLEGMSGDAAKATRSAKELAAAQRGAGQGTTAYDRLKMAVGGLADETADADQRTRSLKDALDLLSGGQISLQAARAKVNSAVLDLKEGGRNVSRDQGYGGKQLVNEDQTLNTTTRNGQQLYTQLTALSDATADAAVATYDLARRNGEDLPTALAKARGEMSRARAEAISAAQSYGLTNAQAKGVADSLGLLPSKVSLLLQTKGMDSTLANLIAVQAEFHRLPNRKTIKVDSLSDGAQQRLRSLGFTVKTVPGTRQIKITAPTAAARKNLDGLIDKLGRTPNSKHVRVSAPSAAAIKSLEAVQAKIRAIPGAKSVIVRAPTAKARKELEALGFRIEKVPGSKNVRVTVPTGGPRKAADAIQQRIDALRGKSVTVTTRHVTIFDTLRDQPSQTADALRRQAENLRKQARGGVVDYFADGGVGRPQRREQHIAQIAPAGAWRVWAEPETGGEAYVPMAMEKRTRSKAVVEEVVGRFGGQVEWFANGGMRSRTGRDYSPMLARSFKQPRNTEVMAGVVRAFDIRTGSDRARTRVVDARAGGRVQVVVVREQQPLIGTMPVTVTDSSATPEQIGNEMMRNLRNAQRGGRV